MEKRVLKRILFYRITKLALICAIFSLSSFIVSAQDFYVDCSSWSNGQGTQLNPFNNLASAFNAADGGQSMSDPDNIYVKGTCKPCGSGDCSNDYNTPTLSFGSKKYITLTTWPGQARAYIDGGMSPTGTVLGTSVWGAEYITIDGLEINGHQSWGGTGHLTIKNNWIHGGGHLDHNNLADPADSELMIIEDCQFLLVQNNKFYDNDGENTIRTGMITYFGRREGDTDMKAVFEYNEFYNGANPPKNTLVALYLKDNADYVTVRNNYFHDLKGGGVGGNGQDGPAIHTKIHNNIFERNNLDSSIENGGVFFVIENDDWQLYNNDFIENIKSDYFNKWTDGNLAIFNNIHVNNLGLFAWWGYSGSPDAYPEKASYIDYNIYHGTSGWHVGDGTDINALSGWQSELAKRGVGSFEDNSYDSNPVLSDLASHNSAEDFRLTSSSPLSIASGGRGGSYTIYRGAWNPNALMWIGYCPDGVGACDVCGIAGGCGGQCSPNWVCADWSGCVNNPQTRLCTDSNNCGTTSGKPIISQTCVSCTPAREICGNGIDDDCDGADQPCTGSSTVITVDSTYSGYSTTAIDDGNTDPMGMSTTWASGESSQPHWILFTFPTANEISKVDIYWAYNDFRQQYMSSQELQVQYWDGGRFVTAAIITNTGSSAKSTISFTKVSTTQLRLYQQGSKGAAVYPNVLWVAEVDYGNCAHQADTNCDGCIEQDELFTFISCWKLGQYSLANLMEAIRLWKNGC